MKRRYRKTNIGLSGLKIVDIVQNFPLLHAYGVGLEYFRHLPEQDRHRAYEYARYMLAYKMDPYINSAVSFFRVVDGKTATKKGKFAKGEWLLYLYKHWAELSGKWHPKIPQGALILGALIKGRHVRITREVKPDCFVMIRRKRIRKIEEFLVKWHNLSQWEIDQKFYLSRVNDKENPLLGVNAALYDEDEQDGW